MPLILTTGAPTASGHKYRDVVGVQHAYPRRYRKAMIEGTPFIYYRGRRSKSLGLPGPAYFGTAVLGAAPDTGEDELLAEVLDYREFEIPLGIKRTDGTYIEPGVEGNPSYWRRGVRTVSDDTMALIITAAGLVVGNAATVAAAPAFLPRTYAGDAARYARSKQKMDDVEAYSVAVATALLDDEFGPDSVVEMPHNNPGYDLLVSHPDGDLHVEVKGTRLSAPVFFMSEGERRHSFAIPKHYRLCVVFDIDLEASSHQVLWHLGELAESSVELRPRVWTGRLVQE